MEPGTTTGMSTGKTGKETSGAKAKSTGY
jgi:hypothetical protein